MESFIRTNWFDLVSVLSLILALAFLLGIKIVKENDLVQVFSIIAILILCGYILPGYSIQSQIKHLKETTDSDSTQFMAVTFLRFGFWWLTFLIWIICYGITHWLIGRKILKSKSSS